MFFKYYGSLNKKEWYYFILNLKIEIINEIRISLINLDVHRKKF